MFLGTKRPLQITASVHPSHSFLKVLHPNEPSCPSVGWSVGLSLFPAERTGGCTFSALITHLFFSFAIRISEQNASF